MTLRFPPRLASMATALALVAFAWSVGRHHPDAATAAEARFLAVLIGLVMVALSLGRRAAPEVVGGGSLVGLALFLPAAQGSRGALVVALLAASIACHAWRTFAGDERLTRLDAATVTIAWAALAGSGRLLDSGLDWTIAVRFVALPLAAAVAAHRLARDRGGTAALVALASLLLPTPGAGWVPVAILIVLAAAGDGRSGALPNAFVIAGACAVTIVRLPEVAVPMLVLVSALAFHRMPVWRWLPAGGALAWALVQGGAATPVGWAVLAVPAALTAGRRQWPLVGAAIALAAGWDGQAAALAPALGLLAVAVEPARTRWQASWSLGLLSGIVVLAAYPWLRRPTADLPAELAGWPILGVALAPVALTALVAAVGARRAGRPARLDRVVVGALLLAAPGLAVLLEPAPSLLPGDAVTLTESRPSWSAELDGEPVRRLTVDSFLIGSGGLDPGVAVATVRLEGPNGAGSEHLLRLGEDTADWASHRLGAATAPEPWITWLAGDGSRARRYRSVWRLEVPVAARRVELVRRAGLGGTDIALLHVDAR